MKTTAKEAVLIWALLLVVGSIASAQQTALPVKVSENGRYFVDQNGTPVFWLGGTQWQVCRDYTLDDAKTILEKTKSHGFTFVNVMLVGVGEGTTPNVYGEKPWIDNNPLTPNEAYFKHADSVFQMARDNNLIIVLTIYHQRYRKYIRQENARSWARWAAERYKDAPNIVWAMVPEAKQSYVPVLRELAEGLHEGDGGRHLVTVHPDPSSYSSSFLHNESWLDFHSIQTWDRVKLIYPMVIYDYHLKPAKPVVMAEGAYEGSAKYGFNATALWIRRQAYYSYLAGGHHTYGFNASDTNWKLLPSWKRDLDAPGAVQMGVLKKIFLARREWWRLVPDQAVFASGGRTFDLPLPPTYTDEKERAAYLRSLGPPASEGESSGDVLHLAARHQDGKWAMLYLADKASFSVNMNKVSAAKVNVFWVNPVSGDSAPVRQEANTGVKSFSTPEGWEDSLLILEAADSSGPAAR